MERAIRKVVVLGANGAMGAGSGAVFAAAGIPTVFLARTRDKAVAGRARAEKNVKSTAISAWIDVGDYAADLERVAPEADLFFEAVAEDMALKRDLFARLDRLRRADAIVATVSSGLSIAGLCEGRSDSFRRHFLGVHFFNPPNAIVGTELVPHAETDPGLVAWMRTFLVSRCGRVVVETTDTPAFAGNRIGFKVLNEVAQLAEEHGVAFLDELMGPHTGRAMSPLTTIDFVGWDVHQAIVDNLYAHTVDEEREAFRLPAYMARLIAAGHLGNKTPERGGFFRKEGKGPEARRLVLDPRTGDYRPLAEARVALPAFVAEMKALHRVGRYRQAFNVLCAAEGREADLLRRILFGYVSYGLSRVGEVVRSARDVDAIMGFGFHWAPPGLLVDTIGARRTIELLERARLPVPRVVVEAADRNRPIFDEPAVDRGRFFYA